MKNSSRFRLLFLNLGISSLLFQVLLLRELVISFYGNEFFLGLILALWLFWTAVGSFLSERLFFKRDSRRYLSAAHLLIAVLIPALILFVRFFKIPGTTGGEIPDFFSSLIFVAAILAPTGLTFGSIFTLGVKASASSTPANSPTSPIPPPPRWGCTCGTPRRCFLGGVSPDFDGLSVMSSGSNDELSRLSTLPIRPRAHGREVGATLSLSKGRTAAHSALLRAALSEVECADRSGDGSTAYFWETLGHILIGLVFNFFLVTFPALPIAFLISSLNLALIFLILPLIPSLPPPPPRNTSEVKSSNTSEVGELAGFPQRSNLLKILSFTLGLLFVFLSVFCGQEVEFLSQRWRFKDLVYEENSLYGHIAVTKSADQHNFYESGLLVGSDEDYYSSEFLVHPTLVQHPSSRRVLLIGGGWNGVLAEILKYPTIERVDYVELDPQFLQVVEKYLSEDLKEAFLDKRVKKHFVDGRFLLKHTDQAFDVVIFNLPNPSTALINRFYTKECFAEVQRILNPKGLFSLNLSTPTDYLSTETENLLSSVYKTLKKEFTQIKILAEENVQFLASNKFRFLDAPEVIKNWKDLKIETAFLTDTELEYRLTSDKNARIQKTLEVNREAALNSDFHPTAYFYQTVFWQTKFSFAFAKILAGLRKPSFWVLVGALISAVFLFSLRRKPSLLSTSNMAVAIVGLGGLTLMAMEVILIFLFQTTLGFIYSKIALLMAIILAGLAGGNFMARKLSWSARRSLLTAQVLIVFYLFLFLKVIPLLKAESGFYLLGAVAGILVGLLFPLANALLTEGAGLLYTADLAGSFWGALLPSLFLIPLFGVGNTLILFVALNFIGALLLLPQRFGR